MKKVKWYLVIFFLVFLTYSNSFRNKFVYDDRFTVKENYFIRDWKNFPVIFTKNYFQSAKENSYRPVVTLTYFLDYSFYKTNPSGYHFTNFIFHLFNSFLIFYVFSLLIGEEKSFFLATLYSVFPVNSEVVNCISYREDLLVVFFCLLSFLFYVYFRQKQKKLFFVFSLVFYLFAVLSKENGVILPFLLLLYEFSFSKKSYFKKQFFLSFFGYLIFLSIFFILRFIIFTNPESIPVSFLGGSIGKTLVNIPLIILRYLKLLLFPYPLLSEYPQMEVIGFKGFFFYFSMFTTVIFLLIFLFAYFFDKKILFGLLWFFIAFLPTSNIFPIFNPFAERYIYLPSIGFLLCLVLIIYKIRWRNIIIGLLSVITISYAFITNRRNRDWYDDKTLWNANYKFNPKSERGLLNLGYAFEEKGEYEKSIFYLTKLLEINPFYPEAYNTRGLAYEKKGEIDKAISDYSTAIKINPNFADAYTNRGTAYEMVGEIDKAISDYSTAIKINPEHFFAYNNRANSYLKKKEIDKAISDYSTAIKINPSIPEIYNNRGAVYLQKGEIDKAISDFTKAINLNPNYLDAYNNRAISYFLKKDYSKALEDMKKIKQKR